MRFLLLSLLIQHSSLLAQDSFTQEATKTTSEPAAVQSSPYVSPAVGDTETVKSENIADPRVKASSPLQKVTAKGKVAKIYPDSKRALITLDSTVNPDELPSKWEFTNSKSESCEGNSVQIQDNTVLLDFTSCANFSQITAGAAVTPSIFQPRALREDVQPSKPSPNQVEPSKPTEAPTAGTDGAERTLVDLQLFPPQKKTIFNFDFNTTALDRTVNLTSSGSKVYDEKVKNSQLTITAMYGLMDNLAMAAAFGQVFDTSHTTDYGPGSTFNGTTGKSHYNGWTDPTYLVVFRVIEQGHAPATVDLAAGHSPKSGDSLQTSSTRDGNAKRGGDATYLGINIGRKYATSSFDAILTAQFLGRAKSHEEGSTVITTADAYTHTSFMIRGQIDATDMLYFRGLIRSDYYSDQKVSTPGLQDTIAKAFSQTSLGLQLLISPAPNFALNIGLLSHSSVEHDGQVGTTKLKRTIEGSEFNLGLTVAF